MSRPASIPPELWDAIPPHVRAAIGAIVSGLEARATQLEARVAELEAQLRQNSSNSSRPPSSDPPHLKPAPPKPASGKRRGGQPGHPKAERKLLPPDETIPLRPTRCSECQHPLAGDDPRPLVHQVHELPAVRPHVTEYRCHRLSCPACGTVTAAKLPPGAVGGFGPRAQAAAALLSGSCRIGKRGVSRVFQDLFGMSISPAAVCDLERKTAAALQPIADEALVYTRGRPANVDETGWREGADKAWLWVAVTEWVVAFLIRRGRDRLAFDDLMKGSSAVLTTDRYGVYTHLPRARRQVCWAHVIRDFQAMVDRKNAGSGIGADLLVHADILFHHWQRVRDGTLTRNGFRKHYAGWLREEVRRLLTTGAACGCAKTAATCREVLGVEESLWTFTRVAGVEPTNNAAEREVRHAVCWRKTSYGTNSSGGSRFVERILTVIASCRRQERNVLAFLMEAIQAVRNGANRPSLVPAS